MKRWLKNALRFLFVTIGVVVLTSISIDATDTLRGSETALTALVRTLGEGKCPSEMVLVERSDRTRFCIDQYEVVTGDSCMFQQPALADETARNASFADCAPQVRAGKLPWTNVTQIQAGELCARAGKRLPSSEEWYAAVRGTPDDVTVCALDRDLSPAGTLASCRSGAGVFDMVGNVWEWVADTATAGELSGVKLPESGYISSVDPQQGVADQSSPVPFLQYNHDYVWTNEQGNYAVMRGGWHGGRSDGGIYSLHAAVSPQFSSPAIGFRCVKSL